MWQARPLTDAGVVFERLDDAAMHPLPDASRRRVYVTAGAFGVSLCAPTPSGHVLVAMPAPGAGTSVMATRSGYGAALTCPGGIR